jgi:hypothetical protein
MQSSVDYGKAFTFPQEDPEWIKKVAIAGVVALLAVVPLLQIIPILLLWGYVLEITRRVIAGETPVLPEWTDFGGLLKKGLFSLVVGLVYALPLILLLACLGLPYLGVAFAGGNEDMANTLATIASVASLCFGCLAAIYALVMAVVMPAAIGRLAATGEIGPALRFGEVFAIVRAKPGVYIIVALLAGLAISVLSSVGSIACGIGAAWGIAYGAIAGGHLYGQAYRVASAGSGAAPMAPSM